MKILNLIFALLVLSIGCQTQVDKNKKQGTKISESPKEILKEETIYNTKCAILYMPDSIQLTTIEKEKSQEELNEIEYDKTSAVEFLDSKNIPVLIEDKKFFKFKKSDGEIVVIDKSSYQKWGIILFMPDKDPKVIFLNAIAEEYESYFNL